MTAHPTGCANRWIEAARAFEEGLASSHLEREQAVVEQRGASLHVNCSTHWFSIRPLLTDIDNLIQRLARQSERLLRDLPPSVWLCAPGSPVEGLRLMAQDVANNTFGPRELDGKRIGVIGSGCGHRQTDNDAGPLVELLGREHDERMKVLHLAASLGVAVDPD